MAQQQIMRKARLILPPSKEFFNYLVKLDIIREEIIGLKVE
jgi:hypothetical protein